MGDNATTSGQTGRVRPRVSFTVASIVRVVTARRRYVCGNHLDPEEHFIEPGDRYVRRSLPPDNFEIGNPSWLYQRVCLNCCPAEHDERRLSARAAG